MTSEEPRTTSTESHTETKTETMASAAEFDLQAVYLQKQAEIFKIKSLVDQRDKLEHSADALRTQHSYLEKLRGTLELTHKEHDAFQEANEALRQDWTVSASKFDQKSHEREIIERDFSKTTNIVSCFSIYNLPLTPVANVTPVELMEYVKNKNEFLEEQLRNNEKLAQVIQGMQEIEAKAQEIEELEQGVTAQKAMSTVMELELQREKAAYEDAIAQLRKDLDGIEKEHHSIAQTTSHSTQTEDTSAKEMDEAVAKAVFERVTKAVTDAIATTRRKMMPLVQVGIDIRDRYEEWEKKSSQDPTKLYNGDRASHYGRALADAVKFLHFSTSTSDKDQARSNYIERYGFTPEFIVNNSRNEKFLDLVDWRVGMKAFKRGSCETGEFLIKYAQMLGDIEKFSPIEITKRTSEDQFIIAYLKMKGWHDAAWKQHKSQRGWER